MRVMLGMIMSGRRKLAVWRRSMSHRWRRKTRSYTSKLGKKVENKVSDQKIINLQIQIILFLGIIGRYSQYNKGNTDDEKWNSE